MEVSRIALVLTVSLSTYLTVRCHTPPNPNPTVSTSQSGPKDRLHVIVGPNYLLFRHILMVSFCAYHGSVVIFYPFTSTSAISTTLATICPSYENLNPDYFTWSIRSVTCLSMILIFTSVRLLAFAQLGSSFTFKLARPPVLKTTGLYAYVQHPSYTANSLLVAFNIFLFFQPDGVMGCWMSENAVKSFWWSVVGWTLAIMGPVAMNMRVRDEERMLKETFGEKWEIWHRKTKRFVPWVF